MVLSCRINVGGRVVVDSCIQVISCFSIISASCCVFRGGVYVCVTLTLVCILGDPLLIIVCVYSERYSIILRGSGTTMLDLSFLQERCIIL